MRPKVNSNRLEISLREKIDFGRSETHFGANVTSVKMTEVKFQTAGVFHVNSKCPQRNKVAQNH